MSPPTTGRPTPASPDQNVLFCRWSRVRNVLVTAPALTLPCWGTQRSSWRGSDVTITGDAELAARLLDAVNII